jgi:hypothetical protein
VARRWRKNWGVRRRRPRDHHARENPSTAVWIAIGVGAAVVGGVGVYFLTRPKTTPQLPSASTTSTSSTTSPAPTSTPPQPPANATNIIVGHRYKITLSSTGFIASWGEAGVAIAKIPATFANFHEVFADGHTFIYTLDAMTSHVEPNSTFALGAIHVPLGIVVQDLGVV